MISVRFNVWMPVVRLATAEDHPEIHAVLVEAFRDDPLARWMVPARRFDQRQRHVFRLVTQLATPAGRIQVACDETTGKILAAAVWMPPGTWKSPPSTVLRALPAVIAAGGHQTGRILGRLTALEHAHPTEPPHWYLSCVGTSPTVRGTGVGSLLMKAALDEQDTAGSPAYLESSNERNLSFYQRLGFVVRSEFTAKAGPPQWLMWRDPAAG